MSSKPKRPAMFDISDILVPPKAPASKAEPVAEPEAVEEPTAPPAEKPKPPKAKEPVTSDMFRTSHYFSRAVHRQLREIALHEDRKVADLINEGIDHVLSSRSYPTAAEMRDKKR